MYNILCSRYFSGGLKLNLKYTNSTLLFSMAVQSFMDLGLHDDTQSETLNYSMEE
jgi:hypothetical protein